MTAIGVIKGDTRNLDYSSFDVFGGLFYLESRVRHALPYT